MMGASDFRPFDNDDAADWLAELEESSDTATIASAFAVVTDIGGEYLEAPDCSNALAAAEIVAALKGHPMAGLPENALAWIDTHRHLDVSSLVPIAQAVVTRIGTRSELKDLWEESEDFSKWMATVNDVSARLLAS